MAGLDEETAAWAARNHGRLTRAGLLASGIPATRIDGLVRQRVLLFDRRGQYRVAGAPRSALQEVLGAVTAVGGMAADETALALAGGDGLALLAPFAVAVGRGRRCRRAGIRAVPADVAPGHRTIIDGVPSMTVERAVISWSPRAPIERLRVVFHDLRRRGLLDVRVLRAVLAALGDDRAARQMSKLLASGVLLGESPPEQELGTIWQPGDPAPARQVWVRHQGKDYRLDLCFLDSRLAPEYDGAVHGAAHRRQDDADRTIALASQQILRIPVTARQLKRPAELRRQLLGLHAQRLADGIPPLVPAEPPAWWNGL
jgi:hypothetical protein